MMSNLKEGHGTTSRAGSAVGTASTVAGGVGIAAVVFYILTETFHLEPIVATFGAGTVATLLGGVAGIVAQHARDVLTWDAKHADNGGRPSWRTLLWQLVASIG